MKMDMKITSRTIKWFDGQEPDFWTNFNEYLNDHVDTIDRELSETYNAFPPSIKFIESADEFQITLRFRTNKDLTYFVMKWS